MNVTASQLAWRSVGISTLGFLLLQLWRPYFFLTDDNLVGWLPVIVALGRNLIEGRTPFEIEQLYGGNFELLRDPSALCFWNPLVWALALLGQTRFYLAIVDIFVGVNLALTAFATTHLFVLWRARFDLKASDGRLLFLVLTWVFSAYAIIVNASWGNFAANMASLPILLLGLFDASRRRGVVLVVCALAQGLLAGHLSPFFYCLAFVAIWCILWVRLYRDCEPLRRFALGGACALGLMSPLLWLAWSGFSQTTRNTDLVTSGQTLTLSISPPEFVLTYLAGILGVSITQKLNWLGKGELGAIVMVLVCAHVYVALCALWALRQKSRAEKTLQNKAPEWLWGVLALALALLIVRPAWLQTMIDGVPLYRSLRFSFREVWLFHFCVAAWLLWRIEGVSPRALRLGALCGALLLACSLLPFTPPSFSRMEADREELLSRRPETFWREVKKQLPPGARILPVIEAKVMKDSQNRVPFCLLGAFNYPALYDVPSASGYLIRGLETPTRQRGDVPGPAGMWTPRAARERLKKEPNLRLLHLRSLQPLVITLDDARSSRRLNLSP